MMPFPAALLGPASAIPLALNIVNPDAETGDISGWSVIRGGSTVEAGPTGGGTLPFEGSYFFYAGDFARSTMAQTIPIQSSLHADIDADRVTLSLNWQHSGQSDLPDVGSFYFAALDAGGVFISTNVTDLKNPSIEAQWDPVSEDFKLPAGTRSVRLYLDCFRGGATSNDYYVDAVSGTFTVSDPTAIELPILNCAAQNGTANWIVTNGQFVENGARSPRIGDTCFYAGNNAFSAFYQNVTVPSISHASIDAATATLNWEFFQYCIGLDTSRVRVIFYEADGITQTGSSTPSYTNFTDPDWTKVAQSAAIPANTRVIRFIQEYDRNAGTSSDGYLDALSAEIVL